MINNRNNMDYMGNWDWQPRILKQQYGQLTLSDVTFRPDLDGDIITRIGLRLQKSRNQVISILRKLSPTKI